MKLVEKGKLFGYLNIFDIIIILLIAGAAAGLFAKTTLLKKMVRDYTVKPARVELLVENIYPQEAAEIKPGAQVTELRSGELLGTVREVRVDYYRDKAADSQGNIHWSPVPGKRNAIITVEGNLKSYNGFFRVGQVNIGAGAKINITSPAFAFQAEILRVAAGS